MKIVEYAWIAQLALAMPDLLAAMAAHPVAATAVMGFVYLLARDRRVP